MPTRPELTEAQRVAARTVLYRILAREGSLAATARAVGTSPQLVAHVLAGRGPGRRLARLIAAAAADGPAAVISGETLAALEASERPWPTDVDALRARATRAELALREALGRVRWLERALAARGRDLP